MRNSLLFKLSAFLLSAVLLIACLTGCKNKKDVYGAESDYIKVSHPETPNINEFSGGNFDDSSSDSGSSDKGGNTGTDNTPSDSGKDSVSSADDSVSKDDTVSSDDTSSEDNSGDSNVNPPKDDQSPVVTF